MSNEVADAIVRRDLFLALSQLGVAVSMSLVAWHPDGLAIAAVATVTSCLLLGAADRSEAGKWLLIGTGTLAIVALLVSTVTSSVPVGVIAPSILGMAVGFALNRVLFGVMRAVPEVRQRRETTD